MGRKSKYPTEEKLKYVLRCIEGKDSINKLGQLFDGMQVMTDAHNGSFPDYIQDPGKGNDEAWHKGVRFFAVFTVYSLDVNSAEQLRCYTGIGAVTPKRSLTNRAYPHPPQKGCVI